MSLPLAFLPVAPDSDFPLHNLPFGVCTDAAGATRLVTALGDHVVDLGALQRAGCFPGPILSRARVFEQGSSLNAFMALGRPAWAEARRTLQRLLSAGEGRLRDDAALQAAAILEQSSVRMQLPCAVRDYTDFYTSKHHAVNCGAMFRDPAAALAPNWVHLPVGYAGRASSVVVSGESVRRPWGQRRPPGAEQPVEGPSQAVDFELEMACIMGTGNELGSSIRPDDAAAAVFGLVLLNDWSARDIQQWEMAPLGPFNGKNWATQVSPWVVTLDALEPFRCAAEEQAPPVLPYLRESRRHTWDVSLTASITPAGGGVEAVVARSNLRYLYWTFPQMIAHHTAGGCNLGTGDLLGSGTVSGPEEGQRGCLFEATRAGSQPLQLAGQPGSTPVQRSYLQDGDQVVLHARCEGRNGVPGLGFGACAGVLAPCAFQQQQQAQAQD